jgi:hypothetical protein
MKTLKVKMDDIWVSDHGKEPKNHSPILDYCRKLISEGEKEDTRLEVYRHRDTPDVIVKSIGEASKWAILENETEGPRFVKYNPMPEEVKQRLRKRPKVSV